MGVSIRKAGKGDEVSLAHIQTKSWKTAFKGILVDEILDKCTEMEPTIRMYKKLLDADKGNGYILEVDGRPHCIAWWDRSRTESMSEYAELICIHSLQSNWRKGYGTKMLNRVLHDMKKEGYDRGMLWVFRDNIRARKFYEANGFVTHGMMKPGVHPEEICYEKQL
ncbi:MAG: GNAT family N-acetyltransferase [Lachnospiraceae bacterium]